mgnify:CR=1 FL=1
MINGKYVVSMIPIKLNSERVKDKNIRTFFDRKPLVSFIAEAVLKSRFIDEAYVYCSSSRIKEYLPDGIKFLQRPGFLDGNDYNCNDIIREFMKAAEADIYSVNHATAPFTQSSSIDRCIEAVGSGSGHDSAFLVKKMQAFFWSHGKAVNFDMQHFPRTQDLEPVYTETSGAYVFTKEVFRKYGRRVGERPYLAEVSERESIDIDTEEEMAIAQAVYRYGSQGLEHI